MPRRARAERRARAGAGGGGGGSRCARRVVGRLRRARLRLLPARARAPRCGGRAGAGPPMRRPTRRRTPSCSRTRSSEASRARERATAPRSSRPPARPPTTCWRATAPRAALVAARPSARRARDRPAGGARRAPAPSLSAAAARLRPQQRAALALRGLEQLPYAEIAAVLGIGAEAVGALLARARLRLHDELRGTALAAAAVRSPDCEDVIPLLAAASDGELRPADAGWADPHIQSCPTCPRTRRAMEEAAATYAAWSPAPPPAWVGAAPLAELGAEAPAAAAGGGRVAAWATPRPRLSAALLG